MFYPYSIDPAQDRDIFSLKDEKVEIGRFSPGFYIFVSGGLGWSLGLGVGRVGVWFAVGLPYGSALVAMATREGQRWR